MNRKSLLSAALVLFCAFLPGASAQDTGKKPVVMVMINEQIWVNQTIIYDYYADQPEVTSLWTSVSQADTAMISDLLQQGFKVVGDGALVGGEGWASRSDILTATNGNARKSAELAGDLEADVIIVGKAISKGVEPLPASRQKSARAILTLRAINVASGEIIAAERGSGSAVATDEISAGADAIQKAVRSVSGAIIDKILKGGSDAEEQ